VFNEKSSLITFHRPRDPSRYIGYRIVEGDPVLTAQPITGYDAMPRRRGAPAPPSLPARPFPESAIPRPDEYAQSWKSAYEDKTFFFRSGDDGTTHFRYTDAHGTRVAIFKPAEDGLDAWMWLEPAKAVPGSYLVEQCLRMSGTGNTFKRRQSAFVPELSEYELWDRGEMRGLSYTRQGDSWRGVDPLRAFAQQSKFKTVMEYYAGHSMPSYTRFHTPAGLALAEVSGVYVDPGRRVQNGLVARESADGKTIAGMYWERSAQLSTHHPADCLHAAVDLGPASSGEPRIVRGKIYWFEGTKEDLLKHWERDFGS
jgi:hypothetical protein